MIKKQYITPNIEVIEVNEMDIITTSSYTDYGDVGGSTESGNIGGSSGEDDFELGAKERFQYSYNIDF